MQASEAGNFVGRVSVFFPAMWLVCDLFFRHFALSDKAFMDALLGEISSGLLGPLDRSSLHASGFSSGGHHCLYVEKMIE